MDPVRDTFARRHLARIVDSSDDAIISKDLDGIIQSWNLAAERMFGYTAVEAIGQSIRIIIPEERQHEEEMVLSRIRAGQIVDHFETRRRGKDGSEVLVSLTISPIVDEAGVIVGASKIARDVTERSRLQAENADRLRTAQTLSGVGTLVASSLDRTTVIQKVADLATALTRAEFGAFFYHAHDPRSGKAQTQHALSAATPEILAKFPNPRATALLATSLRFNKLLRSDDVAALDRDGGNSARLVLPAGLPPLRSCLAVPVKAASGDLLGGLFFGHSSPAVFTSAHEQLVTGVASWASLALENARLYAETREADRLKDEFLAVLSHELRTPLNAIMGYARLLRGNLLSPEKAARGLETLERNAVALTQIVDDVLDVSRIVSGKIRLDTQPVDLPLVVDNAMATVQHAADARGVTVQAFVDANVEPVSGDPHRLQQVVGNLLSNAVKFTPRDGQVQIRVRRVDSLVEISVSDTGIGIRPDFLPHVFERFRQADAGTTRKTGGLGLGLSIARQIVELHGGSVDVASDGEGRGTTFWVRLPSRMVHDNGIRDPLEDTRAERRLPLAILGSLKGVRVLAVDDEVDALGLLRVVLEAAGAEVIVHTSPVEAIDRIASVRPDALVVDLGMPELDGFEFIARVRASDNADIREIPAAALTAFARADDRTKALRSGFEMHLAKPVDPAELVASVATLVRRSRKGAG